MRPGCCAPRRSWQRNGPSRCAPMTWPAGLGPRLARSATHPAAGPGLRLRGDQGNQRPGCSPGTVVRDSCRQVLRRSREIVPPTPVYVDVDVTGKEPSPPRSSRWAPPRRPRQPRPGDAGTWISIHPRSSTPVGVTTLAPVRTVIEFPPLNDPLRLVRLQPPKPVAPRRGCQRSRRGWRTRLAAVFARSRPP